MVQRGKAVWVVLDPGFKGLEQVLADRQPALRHCHLQQLQQFSGKVDIAWFHDLCSGMDH
jgi:hypothetical protein